MSNINAGDKEIDARARAAVGKHKGTIIQRFCEGAAKQGHNIKPKDVDSVTYTGLEGLGFDVLSFKLGKFVIEDPKDLTYLDGSSWDNNASTPGHMKFHVGKETTDSYSWSLTAGVTTTASVSSKLEFGVPEFKGSIEATLSVETSLSVTHGSAYSEKHTWDDNFDQDVAPFTRLEKTVYAQQVTGHVPFKIESRAKGKALVTVAFHFHGSRTHRLKIDLATLLQQSGTTVVSEGMITGLQGYKFYVVSKETALTDEERKNLASGLTRFELQDSLTNLSI